MNIAIKQKGKLREHTLGYISVPLIGFHQSRKPVTNWYKLGPKPNKKKKSLKLRGDLYVTIAFLLKSDAAITADEHQQQHRSSSSAAEMSFNVDGRGRGRGRGGGGGGRGGEGGRRSSTKPSLPRRAKSEMWSSKPSFLEGLRRRDSRPAIRGGRNKNGGRGGGGKDKDMLSSAAFRGRSIRSRPKALAFVEGGEEEKDVIDTTMTTDCQSLDTVFVSEVKVTKAARYIPAATGGGEDNCDSTGTSTVTTPTSCSFSTEHSLLSPVATEGHDERLQKGCVVRPEPAPGTQVSTS